MNCYVRENADGSIYYPDTLPKPRSTNNLYDFAPLAFYFSVGCYLMTNNPLSFPLLQCISLMFLNKLLYKSRLFFEEKQHLKALYDNSYKVLLESIFCKMELVLFIACYACLYYFYKVYGLPTLHSYNPICIVFSLLITFDLERIIRLYRSPVEESLFIDNMSGMDYGSGMAHSFFHGYLKLVLPKYGDTPESFKDLIYRYEATQQVKIRVKKLFILIPLSAKCPATLDNIELGIEESRELPEKIITVAGVKNRVYKNSVYKILLEGVQEKVYVCLEYATPLKTLYDVFNSGNSRYSAMYKRHCKQIVLKFYETLKIILQENPECNDMCELIFYKDQLKNGEYRKDIGKIVLERINELSRNN